MSEITTTRTKAEPRLEKQEHLDLLKGAISANLDARLKHDKRQERAMDGKPAKLQFMDLTVPEERLYLESVIADPVRKALKRQLKELGWQLFRLLGSTEAMLKIAEEVASHPPGQWSYRIDIIDKNWDGIGSKTDIWAA